MCFSYKCLILPLSFLICSHLRYCASCMTMQFLILFLSFPYLFINLSGVVELFVICFLVVVHLFLTVPIRVHHIGREIRIKKKRQDKHIRKYTRYNKQIRSTRALRRAQIHFKSNKPKRMGGHRECDIGRARYMVL